MFTLLSVIQSQTLTSMGLCQVCVGIEDACCLAVHKSFASLTHKPVTGNSRALDQRPIGESVTSEHSLCIVAMNVWFKYGLTDLMTLFFLTSPWLHSVVHWFGPSKSQTSPDPLDSFYSQVPGGKCHEWYEGEGEIWEMSGCYVDFKLF